MNGYLFAGLVIGLLAFVFIFISWAGKCKKCGSWNNWIKETVTHDDHQPSMRFINLWCTCSKCGHKVQREQEARRVTDM